MEMQTIKREIDINASKEKVWNVLLDDTFTRAWYKEFSEGTHVETDWEVGSKAVFTDNTGDGLISSVIANKPAELLSMQFEGMVKNGVEDYESAGAKALKGGFETYRLSERNGVTHLAITSDTGADYFEFMAAAWDKALQKIKELSESN